MQNLEQMEPHISYPILASTVNNNDSMNRLSSFTRVDDMLSFGPDEIMNSPSPVHSSIAPGVTFGRGVHSSESIVSSDTSNAGSNRSDLSMNNVDEVRMHEDMLEFGHDFNEDYCKPSTEEESCTARKMTDGNGNDSGHQRNKSEEDGDSDDMLGGVFAFSEECEYFFAVFYLIEPYVFQAILKEKKLHHYH